MDHWLAAADLLVGAACAGCGRPALDLCPTCRAALRPDPHEVPVRRLARVPVVAAGTYGGPLRRTVLAWKEQGRAPLTDVLARLLAASVVHADVDGPVVLVPVPTSLPARWRRGDDLVLRLARVAAAELTSVGVTALVVPALRRVRSTRDQAGLGATQRADNLHGAFAVRRRAELRGGASLVVVDDVVTTGSTLAEAVRALGRMGHTVSASAVVAATPGRTPRERR